MTDVNKITKGITLTPRMVQEIQDIADADGITFTHTAEKALGAYVHKKARDPEDIADLVNNIGKFPQYWMRLILWELQDIHELLEDNRAKRPKAGDD